MPTVSELESFLDAVKRREKLLAWLRERDIPCRLLPDDYPGHGGGVQFTLGDENWCADYWQGGVFRFLTWA